MLYQARGGNLINERSAQFKSIITVWMMFCISVYVTGLMVEVNVTIYQLVVGFILTYLTIGHLVLKSKDIDPASSRKILMGQVDPKWAIKHWYWTCWWPMYIETSKKNK